MHIYHIFNTEKETAATDAAFAIRKHLSRRRAATFSYYCECARIDTPLAHDNCCCNSACCLPSTRCEEEFVTDEVDDTLCVAVDVNVCTVDTGAAIVDDDDDTR
jgi:hypothetical protein